MRRSHASERYRRAGKALLFAEWAVLVCGNGRVGAVSMLAVDHAGRDRVVADAVADAVGPRWVRLMIAPSAAQVWAKTVPIPAYSAPVIMADLSLSLCITASARQR